MVRVCTFEGCKTSARFNHMGETKGRFCSKHKEAGMIDIVHPHCKVEGCSTLASFNVSGQSRGEYCSQHKLVLTLLHPSDLTTKPVCSIAFLPALLL